jgi:hypothetical protein
MMLQQSQEVVCLGLPMLISDPDALQKGLCYLCIFLQELIMASLIGKINLYPNPLCN